ncbi:hypothetical protein [Paraburkholderia strydomiana]|uniref:hypothetical protein n=1 Tax=Paraburkholderia strydomiana TaxID=1245417 RepID=UPI002863A378|nr:hypothetical protein [Paraburkholderia strydomiana]MDR7010000.1 hypothetical protein [Paraburkholderia strydomiana]
MSNRVKRKRTTTVCIETAYQLELAVGASHVASMLHPASRHACVADLSASFTARHGSTNLKRFLLALAEKLDARANKPGALEVRQYATNGGAPQVFLTAASAVMTKRRARRTASS